MPTCQIVANARSIEEGTKSNLIQEATNALSRIAEVPRGFVHIAFVEASHITWGGTECTDTVHMSILTATSQLDNKQRSHASPCFLCCFFLGFQLISIQ